MSTPTIADYMKYADLQMAAEALYNYNAKENLSAAGTPGDPSGSVGHYSGAVSTGWLTTGNEHASKFTQTDAANFAADWMVVDHISNTKTGFSGTLFENTRTHERVMSLRSTEFIDDAARDNQATNAMEVAKCGWAFGQIADMEAWYQSLKASGKLSTSQHFSVTGYSLGGHLATAFNLMHKGDAFIDQVVTFNGAGVGTIKSPTDSLNKVISDFNELRQNVDGLAIVFDSPALNAVYATLRQHISNGEVPSSADYAMLDAVVVDPDVQNSQFSADKARIRAAMDRVVEIDTEVMNVAWRAAA